MPAKSKKTSNSTTNSDSRRSLNSRVDGSRKRTQNRIAQQCLRERRAASSRHMDNMFNTMRFASETDQSQRYAALLEAHMKLARENQLMEDALFRLRKKLLSLSNTTAMAADDPVFDMILGRENTREPSPAATAAVVGDIHEPCGGDGKDPIVQRHPTRSPQNLADEWPLHTMEMQEGNVTANPTSSTTNLEETTPSLEAFLERCPGQQQIPEALDTIVDASLNALSFSADLQHAEDSSEQQKQPKQQPFPCLDGSHLQMPTDSLFFPDINIIGMSLDLPTSDSIGQPQQLDSPWDICSFGPPQKLTVHSGYEFSNKVLQAAFQCISRAQQSGLARHLSADQLTQQVAVAAVNLIGRASGMQQYLYGMNGAPYMERIMYWRLATGARAVVPSPFRPTPLQCSLSAPKLAVDFINWPDIRDQILLAGSSIDLDALCRDIVLNTVIEIPQQRTVVNVFRQYQSFIHSKISDQRRDSSDAGTPTSAIDPGWVFFEINRTDSNFQPWVPDPVEEALALELLRWVQRFSKHRELSLFLGMESEEVVAPEGPESPLGLLDSKFRKERSAACHPLTNTKDWKLSKDFAAKYPFIDCSSACTTFETCTIPSAA